jgi:hypothetical protein
LREIGFVLDLTLNIQHPQREQAGGTTLAMDTGMRGVGFLQKNCWEATIADSGDSKDDNNIEKSLSTAKPRKGALNMTKTARGYLGLIVFLWAIAN